MLQGLQLMERAELNELAKLARLDARSRENLDDDGVRRHILQWAARAVGCSKNDPAAIEEACLNWLAGHWDVDTRSLEDVDELERALRIRIAEDASEYLSPVWWCSCAIIAAGPKDAIPPKVRLLEKAASLVVPSRSARKKLTDKWIDRCQDWGLDGLDKQEVREAVTLLEKAPERVDQCMTLALIISLSDGRLAMEEERLIRDLGSRLQKSHEAVSDWISRVNALYWGHTVEVTPKKGLEEAQADKMVAMEAAQMTLDSGGILEGLCLEACDKVVTEAPKDHHAPKSGWQRVLGTVSGLKQFFSQKMRSDEQTNLVRLIYLSIIRQHAFAAAQAEAAAAAARAQAESAAKEMASFAPKPAKEQVRSIKLD